MGQITADQSQAVMAALSTNVDWASIDFEVLGLQDIAIRDAKEAGAQFAAFLRNRCRLLMESFLRNTGELVIRIPALKRPTLAELQAKWSWIRKIERDTSPEGPVTLNLATVLRDVAEGSINGPEYERRISSSMSRLLGYQQLAWLIEHQDEYPAFMALLGKVYTDFSALVVVLETAAASSRAAVRTASVGARTGTGLASASISMGVWPCPASSKTFCAWDVWDFGPSSLRPSGFGSFGLWQIIAGARFVCDMINMDSRSIRARLRLCAVELRAGACRNGDEHRFSPACNVFALYYYCYLVRGAGGLDIFDIPNSIQSREYSKDGGEDGFSHNRGERERQPQRPVRQSGRQALGRELELA